MANIDSKGPRSSGVNRARAEDGEGKGEGKGATFEAQRLQSWATVPGPNDLQQLRAGQEWVERINRELMQT